MDETTQTTKKTQTLPVMLKPIDVARLFLISKSHLHKLVKQGQLPEGLSPLPFGQELRFPTAQIAQIVGIDALTEWWNNK